MDTSGGIAAVLALEGAHLNRPFVTRKVSDLIHTMVGHYV